MGRVLFGIFIAACVVGACSQSPRSSSDDDDAQSSSAAVNGAGGATTSTTNVGGTDPSGTGGSPSCKMGGESCAAYTECCSGVCSNQICTSCAGEGQSCSAIECCGELDCYGNPPTCQGGCKIDGENCTLASECCSNVCDLGTCADNGCNVGDCMTCVLGNCAAQACQSQIQACYANPECAALLSCASTCTDSACVQQCGLMHPNGINDATVAQQCICVLSTCGSDCSGSLCF